MTSQIHNFDAIFVKNKNGNWIALLSFGGNNLRTYKNSDSPYLTNINNNTALCTI